jgi:hypothetical protein
MKVVTHHSSWSAVKRAREQRAQKLATEANRLLQQLPYDLLQSVLRVERCTNSYFVQKQEWALEYNAAIEFEKEKVWNLGPDPLLAGKNEAPPPADQAIDFEAKRVSASLQQVQDWIAANADRDIEEIDLEVYPSLDVAAERDALNHQWELFCTWQELPTGSGQEAAERIRAAIAKQFAGARTVQISEGDKVRDFSVPEFTNAVVLRYKALYGLLDEVEIGARTIENLLKEYPAANQSYADYLRTHNKAAAVTLELELRREDSAWIEAQHARLPLPESKGDLPAPSGLLRQKATILLILAALLLLTVGVQHLWPSKPITNHHRLIPDLGNGSFY